MPIEIKDTDNGLGVIFTGLGTINDDEFLDSYLEHLSQDWDEYKKYVYALHDWTAVEEVQVSSKSIEQIATHSRNMAEVNPMMVTALIATQEVTFGLSRMWEILVDGTGWEIMVIQNLPDAKAWVRQKVEAKFQIKNLSFS